MRQLFVGALAAGVLFSMVPGTPAQAGRTIGQGNDDIQITATGRVQSVAGLGTFVLEARRMTFRVSYRGAVGQQAPRTGDRVRVTGDLVDTDRIVAENIQILGGGGGPIGGGGRPGRPSRITSGTIRDIDREGRRLSVGTATGVVRVTWDDDTEFIRNTTRSGPREFRVGDEVRIAGSRTGNDLVARRVLYGGQPGWQNAGIGEIVSLDARAQEADVDFDGEVVTVRLRNATIRRAGRPAEIDDLRLGQDVRVTGTARGRDTVEASLVEVVRQIGDGRPGGGVITGGNNDNDPGTQEGRIVNVAEGVRTFRIQTTGGREIRFTTNDDTNFFRGTTRSSFRALQEGQRVRVRARREGTDWIATRVELL